MADIIKKIKKMERSETSPLEKLLSTGNEPPIEEEVEKMEVTHYGRTVAGTEPSENPTRAGSKEADPEPVPRDMTILKSKAFRELSIDELDKGPEAPPDPAPGDSPAGGEERVIRLTAQDERKVKHIKLICHLLEEGFFEEAIETVRELKKTT